MRAWHFTDGMKLRDGTPLEVGRTYTHDGPLVLCSSGLHASVRAVDALMYAPGAVVSLVECDGETITSDDKLVCRSRKVLACADVRLVLVRWAVDCATAALLMADVDDQRCWNALEAAMRIADGDTSDAARAAARDAAYAAARAAACAAGAAAWAAAWAAARDAARDAAKDAACAAGAAARAAAGDAAWAEMNALLEEYLHEALEV